MKKLYILQFVAFLYGVGTAHLIVCSQERLLKVISEID